MCYLHTIIEVLFIDHVLNAIIWDEIHRLHGGTIVQTVSALQKKAQKCTHEEGGVFERAFLVRKYF